jgi:hypothetical protein
VAGGSELIAISRLIRIVELVRQIGGSKGMQYIERIAVLDRPNDPITRAIGGTLGVLPG